MKKKFLALLLAAIMIVGILPTVAFADAPINKIESTYQKWSVEQLKGVNSIKDLISVTNPSNLNDYISDSNTSNCVGLFGEGNAQIGYYQFSTHNWAVSGRDISDVRPDEVKKVIICCQLRNGDDPIPDLATSGTVSVNGEELSDSYDGYGSCYIWPNDGKSVYIQVAYEPVEELSGDCTYTATFAKVGMAAVGVVTAVVVTKVVVDKLHEIKAEKAAAAEEAKLAEMPMVKMGDSGDAVKTLQTELNAQGYNCGEADGVFGQNTLNAVIAFQTAKGLTADGIVGELTWAELL